MLFWAVKLQLLAPTAHRRHSLTYACGHTWSPEAAVGGHALAAHTNSMPPLADAHDRTHFGPRAGARPLARPRLGPAPPVPMSTAAAAAASMAEPARRLEADPRRWGSAPCRAAAEPRCLARPLCTRITRSD